MASMTSLLVGVAIAVLSLGGGETAADGDVITGWGLDDKMAAVGRLFEYQLNTGNAGNILKVTEAGSETLPNWLHFNEKSSTLEGVPTSEELRQTFSIHVLYGQPAADQSDDFDISVVDEIPHSDETEKPDGESQRPIRCLPGSAVTTATIVVDVDVDKLSASDRVRILRAIADYLGLPVGGLRISTGSGPTSLAADSSALVAGAGNAASPKSQKGALLQWEVGCGNVFAVHMDVLQRVESAALDGKMAAAISNNIIGWHVANKKPPTATRLKRQAARISPTSTPTIGVRPPTARPVPTRTIVGPGPTKLPPTRVMPTVSSSPAISPTRVTTERPHRTKTGGRHFSTTTRPRPTRRPRPIRPESKPSTPTAFPDIDELEPSVITPVVTKAPSVATPPLIVPQTTVKVPSRELTPKPPVVVPDVGDFKCINKPDPISVYVNGILNYKIPIAEFFSGAAPPGTVSLKLLGRDGNEVSHWLQLDEATGTLVGMPMQSHIGYLELTLRGTDSAGRVANCEINSEVRSPAQVRPNSAFESSATFSIDYDQFVNDASLRMDIIKKLAGAFGDSDPSQLVITSVRPGSVVLSWTNSSVTDDGQNCPADRVRDIQSRMLNDDGSIRESFRESLSPYEMTGASMTKQGSCAAAVPPPPGTLAPAPVETQKADMTTIVIPILIIVVVVVLAIIIACCLIRKKKQAKKAASPDKTVKHGAPVIFAYELDDTTSATPSKPLIGSNGERPPAPPNYQVATGTPPMGDHRRPLLADPTADQMSPLKFQPPPGSSVRPGGAGSQQRVPPAYQST